jgi:hypothetical protein
MTSCPHDRRSLARTTGRRWHEGLRQRFVASHHRHVPLGPQFDETSPFFPLVTGFTAATHGWGYLLARVVGRIVADESDEAVLQTERDLPGDFPTPRSALRDAAKLPSLLAPLNLACRTQDERLVLPEPDEMADQIAHEHLTVWS